MCPRCDINFTSYIGANCYSTFYPRAHARARGYVIVTPRAHARARGYVIGRGVYYIYIIIYYISAKLFSIFQNTHFQRSILTQIGFSSNLMASGTA